MTAEDLAGGLRIFFKGGVCGMRMLYEGMQTGAITVPKGIFAVVDFEKCTGCGLCARECPASVIKITDRNNERVVMKVGAY